MSVEENLRFGAPDRSDAELLEAAQRACADDFVKQLPEGYKTVLAQAGVTLSGGQRQRLGLARSFLRPTPLLLLDEPTSALDVTTESKIMRALAEYGRDRTCLIVTHRLGLARQADLILMMENGELVESGPHDRLLRADGPYARLWNDAQRQSLEAAEVAG
jgi:ABC-type multidrug transport system fused ATPase/permease subunit